MRDDTGFKRGRQVSGKKGGKGNQRRAGEKKPSSEIKRGEVPPSVLYWKGAHRGEKRRRKKSQTLAKDAETSFPKKSYR